MNMRYAQSPGRDIDEPTSVKREPLVRLTLDEISRSIEDLNVQVEALEGRLTPCLAVTINTSGPGQASAPRPAMPPLVEILQELRQKITVITRRVREITDRVEI